jgi:hypothetical protein
MVDWMYKQFCLFITPKKPQLWNCRALILAIPTQHRSKNTKQILLGLFSKLS